MGRTNYMWLFLFVILTFLGMILMLPEESNLFVQEIYLIMFLLVIAGTGLYAVASGVNHAWLLFGLFFATTLLNTFYLKYAIGMSLRLFAGSIGVSILGFLVSIASIKRPQSKKRIPKTIIVNTEPNDKVRKEKKTVSKPAKKTTKKKSTKTSKKKPAKKATKKVTKKKAAKKVKKTAKRKVAKKTSSKKKVKRSTKKRSKK